jgi:hypothetical protein
MNEIKEINKSCLTCKYFQSYYDMYDSIDDQEPTDMGRCMRDILPINNDNPMSSDEDSERRSNIAGGNVEGCERHVRR